MGIVQQCWPVSECVYICVRCRSFQGNKLTMFDLTDNLQSLLQM